jgi:GT2 family glycosyltransferase
MGDRMKIGAVTVTYNSRQVIDGFLDSLLHQTYSDFVLYVVDNASSDGTLEVVRRYQDPRIHIIRNQTNVGVAEGNNQGITAALKADCGAVLLVNNDTEFESSLLQLLVDGMVEHACDMVAPKILYHDKPQLIWCAGGGFRPWKGHGGMHYGLGEIDRGQFDTARRIELAPTCCLLIRTEVFGVIGLMDSLYFVYTDDTDFCFRAMREGVKLFYLPSATMLHKVSSLTGGTESDFTIRYCTRNHVYFILKNLGLGRGLYYLPEFQIRLLAKLILGKVGFAKFVLQQRAFLEGVGVWRSSLARWAGMTL